MNNSLNDLLQEWQPNAPPPESVRREVWHRIEQSQLVGWQTWFAPLPYLLTRPTFVAGIMALALTLGIVLGFIASSQAQTDAYLHSVSFFRHTQ